MVFSVRGSRMVPTCLIYRVWEGGFGCFSREVSLRVVVLFVVCSLLLSSFCGAGSSCWFFLAGVSVRGSRVVPTRLMLQVWRGGVKCLLREVDLRVVV